MPRGRDIEAFDARAAGYDSGWLGFRSIERHRLRLSPARAVSGTASAFPWPGP